MSSAQGSSARVRRQRHNGRILPGWLSWAKRSRLPAFVKLAETIDKYRPLIWNTLNHELSNARVGPTPTCACSPDAPAASTAPSA
jgi:transposase